MPREALLARTLVELADTLVDDFDVVELLTLLADRCVEVLDVGAAGLMLVAPDGELRVMASSSEAMRVLELFELQAQEGPCLDCYRTGQPVVNQDLAAVDGRWPRFAAEALAAGFRSVHALPMRLRGTVIGALNLFRIDAGRDAAGRHRRRPGVRRRRHHRHPPAPRRRSRPRSLNEQLNHALNSRVVIEQAKGMVAERDGLDMEQAFPCCAATPATTTCASSTSPATSSTARWPPPRSTRRPRRKAESMQLTFESANDLALALRRAEATHGEHRGSRAAGRGLADLVHRASSSGSRSEPGTST